ncbi:MAG: hypothetical protein ACIAS6_09045 [Phycisphaerales bacterium JB060]
MLSGLGQSEGFLERLIQIGGSGDASLVAGIAIVVGIMLWSAGARAVSLAFAAAGGTAGLFAGFTIASHASIPTVAGIPGSLITAAGGAAVGVVISLVAMRLVIAAAAGLTAASAIAGLAIVLTPHLPPSTTGSQSVEPATTAAVQPIAFDQTAGELAAGWDVQATDPAPASSDQSGTSGLDAIVDRAATAWQRVPEQYQGYALVSVLMAGLLGAMCGGLWPGRVASATTAFMGAAIWPLGAIYIQSAAGTPVPAHETPIQSWLIAWLVLGVVGLFIQRLVVRKVAQA